MALARTVAWDVQSGGDDTNGGGFDTAFSSGTDRSQTTAPFVTIDGVTIVGTTSGASSGYIVTGYTVTAADVGNTVNITGGVNFTVGRYTVVATIGSTIWVLDRACATGVGAAGTGRMGGCFATIGAAIAAQNAASGAEQTIYVKLGTYQVTTAITTTTASSGSGYQNRMFGYNTTHGDAPTGANRPTIAVGTGAGINGVVIGAANGFTLKNFIIDGTATSGSKGLVGITCAQYAVIVNVWVKNFTNEGVITTSNNILDSVEVSGCAGASGTVTLNSSPCLVDTCNIHDNTQTGVYVGAPGCTIIDSVIANNTGGSSDGVYQLQYNAVIDNCLIFGNGRDGLRFVQNYSGLASRVKNNIIAKNGGIGFNFPSAPTYTSFAEFRNNAFWSNTGGNYGNLTAADSDIALSADPFVNSTGSPPDFSLNAIAGAGALLRSAGVPGAFPGLTSVGYLDIGPLQSAPAGGMLYVPNLEGA